MADAPRTRVNARIASSPMSAEPVSKASIRATRLTGTLLSAVTGMPAASIARMTRGMEMPLRAEISESGTSGSVLWVTRSPRARGYRKALRANRSAGAQALLVGVVRVHVGAHPLVRVLSAAEGAGIHSDSCNRSGTVRRQVVPSLSRIEPTGSTPAAVCERILRSRDGGPHSLHFRGEPNWGGSCRGGPPSSSTDAGRQQRPPNCRRHRVDARPRRTRAGVSDVTPVCRFHNR